MSNSYNLYGLKKNGPSLNKIKKKKKSDIYNTYKNEQKYRKKYFEMNYFSILRNKFINNIFVVIFSTYFFIQKIVNLFLIKSIHNQDIKMNNSQ